MKRQFLLIGLLCLSAVTFGQKKEIKKAEKALASGNATEALNYINQAEGMLSGADEALKTQFYVAKGEIFLADAGTTDFGKLKSAAEAFQSAQKMDGAGKFTDRVNVGMQNLRVALVNSAVADRSSVLSSTLLNCTLQQTVQEQAKQTQ